MSYFLFPLFPDTKYNRMKHLQYLLILALLAGGALSCNDDDDDKNKEEARLRYKVNEFIYENMRAFYLWKDYVTIPAPDKQTDPVEYFNTMRYKDEGWSMLVDNARELIEELQGEGETFGYHLTGGTFSNSDALFAVVNFVFPGSPAAQAGLKRGSIILKIDGEGLTRENYTTLYAYGTRRLTLGKLSGNSIYEDATVTLSSRKMEQNPVLISQVINKGAHTIGYLLYTDFVENFNTQLTAALNSFRSAGVTDLVLDLRYNTGGDNAAAVLLGSAIVPKEVADGRQIFYKSQWNKEMQKELETYSELSHYIQTNFEPVDCNLELPSRRVYILTSPYSASASELIIIGLDPYMEVITIGETTHGKYTSMMLFSPTIQVNGEWVEDTEINNWLMAPVVAKFMNTAGFTDFADGIEPTYQADDILIPAVALGDETELLLKKAIGLITGVSGGDAPESRTDAAVFRPQRDLRYPANPLKGHLVLRADQTEITRSIKN